MANTTVRRNLVAWDRYPDLPMCVNHSGPARTHDGDLAATTAVPA